jgi:hypothetical protein
VFSTAYIPHISPPSTSSNGDPKYVGFFCAFCRFFSVYVLFWNFMLRRIFFRALSSSDASAIKKKKNPKRNENKHPQIADDFVGMVTKHCDTFKRGWALL